MFVINKYVSKQHFSRSVRNLLEPVRIKAAVPAICSVFSLRHAFKSHTTPFIACRCSGDLGTTGWGWLSARRKDEEGRPPIPQGRRVPAVPLRPPGLAAPSPELSNVAPLPLTFRRPPRRAAQPEPCPHPASDSSGAESGSWEVKRLSSGTIPGKR